MTPPKAAVKVSAIPKLDREDREVIVAALDRAIESYATDEKTMRQMETDIANGRPVQMFPSGDEGVKVTKKLADQCYLKAQAARELLKKFVFED